MEIFRRISSLGKSNKTKLTRELGFRNINEAIEHYGGDRVQKRRKYNDDVKNVAYQIMQQEYNNTVELLQEDRRQQSKLKTKEKYQLKKTQLKETRAKAKISKLIKSKKFILKPNETAFDRYNKYTIPASVSEPYRTPNPLAFRTEAKPNSLTKEDFISALDNAYQYLYPIIKDNLKRYKTIRTYILMDMLAINTSEDIELRGTFTAQRNLGRIDTSSIHEFREYYYKKALENFNAIREKDYIEVYGLGEINLQVLQYSPLKGLSYKPIPKFILDSKSVVNIKNTDELCFLWCCVASRHLPARDAERVKQYEPYLNEFKYDKADMPMKVNKIAKFEKANSVNINVYMVDNEKEKTKIPIHISKQDNEEVINLFLHDEHYSLIKNYSRFCGGDLQNTCPNCMKSYACRLSYKRHLAMCKELNADGATYFMPKENTVTKFNDYAKQKRLPVVMYADFESSLMKTKEISKTNLHSLQNSLITKEYITNKHTANSYRIRIVSDVDLKIPLNYEYCGEDTDTHFVKQICELDRLITYRLRELSAKNIKPKLTVEEVRQFREAKSCSLCGDELVDDRVRDHCHFTGKYCGAAHKACNVKATQLVKGNIKIPMFFHNANYDIKCFINAFRTLKGDDYIRKIGGVPCNMEIFKSLNINNICIMDSYAHLTCSLAKLIENLPDDKKHSLKEITVDKEKFELINKKGFYPYEFVDSFAKLDTPIGEIKRKDFDSKLTLSKLNDAEWAQVQTVIEKFDMKTLRDWHDLYLKIDVFGLCDVFEYYRELSMETYGLDPAHYIGLPSFTWQAGLKSTGVKLQNITDENLYMFFEKMKRGGVSVISHRYAKANNQYLPDYDESKESTFIYQVDCNNLYGWSMCENLPVNEIEWDTNFDEGIIQSYKSTDNVGYVLECDLEYPAHLHDEHNDYPLAPEHQVINGHKKLAPNLRDKKEYILHIDNLQYYLSKGMILKQVHRVVRFNQSSWLKAYIEKNSKLRQSAKNDFEKDFYKLLNNAFYGKTMENVRGRINVQFCLNQKMFTKHSSSPLFANQINMIKEDSLYLVKTHKKSVELNKPIYIGACILESSKLLMFKFHYDTMKVKYPDSIMMKTDTDSLCYLIQTDDLYENLKQPILQKQIEFSNYPKEHPLYNCDRKKQVGIFQDESVDGKMAIISEYVGLRAKSYSNNLFYPSIDAFKCKKKSKGVPSRHIDQRVSFDDYKTCLFDKKNIKLGDANGKDEHKEKIYSFRSFNLSMYSVEQSKIALSYGDDKRFILPDGIQTLALGHYRIAELQID